MEKMIEALEHDPKFVLLKEKYEKTNFFEIIGNSWKELWHSSFICWLLDPAGSHGLGEYALNGLMELYYKKQFDNEELAPENRIDLNKKLWSNMKFSTEEHFINILKEVSMQYNCEKRQIDIFGRNADAVLVIENKIKTKEHDEQTSAYYQFFNNEVFDKKKKYFVYLRMDEKDKPIDRHFICITYQEIYDKILSQCVKEKSLSLENRIIVENYIHNLSIPCDCEKIKFSERYKKPMVFADREICEEIYNDNKEAFTHIRTKVESNKHLEFFDKYGNLVNIILESIGKKAIKSKAAKVEVMDQLIALCEKGVIKPNEESSEFVARLYTTDENSGAFFIIQLVLANDDYYIISGYEHKNEYTGKEEIDPLKDGDGNTKKFYSVTKALDEAIFDYKVNFLGIKDFKMGSNTGPNAVLLNRDNKKISDLYNLYCVNDNKVI